jgi:hypothetical protein
MVPFITYPPTGSDNPRDLWKWLTTYEEKTGGDVVLAIPHNGSLAKHLAGPLMMPFDSGSLFPRERRQPPRSVPTRLRFGIYTRFQGNWAEKMRRILCLFVGISAVVWLSGCSDDPRDPSEPLTARADFSTGQHGWTAGFADYPVGNDAIFRLESDYRNLPAPLDTSQGALYISGVNRSDDLWMYWKGQIVGLAPNTRYRASFDVEFATNVPSGCIGVGGSPGESVWVKAGAAMIEPESVVVNDWYRMNVDKGNQSNGGQNAVVLGDVANSQSCGQQPQWELKLVSSMETIEVTADADGRVWLFVGTDSGFESRTEVFYTRLEVTFEPLSTG